MWHQVIGQQLWLLVLEKRHKGRMRSAVRLSLAGQPPNVQDFAKNKQGLSIRAISKLSRKILQHLSAANSNAEIQYKITSEQVQSRDIEDWTAVKWIRIKTGQWAVYFHWVKTQQYLLPVELDLVQNICWTSHLLLSVGKWKAALWILHQKPTLRWYPISYSISRMKQKHAIASYTVFILHKSSGQMALGKREKKITGRQW